VTAKEVKDIYQKLLSGHQPPVPEDGNVRKAKI
jgi:hypothetical protein